MPPMMIASQHLTVPHPAVMPTKPASKPLQKPGTSKALGATTNRRSRNTTKPPTQGAKVVLAATNPAEGKQLEVWFCTAPLTRSFTQCSCLLAHASRVTQYHSLRERRDNMWLVSHHLPAECASPVSCICNVLPGLNPYQPNHKKKVPITQNGT
eukprot:3045014-Amphidinium_carterae.1